MGLFTANCSQCGKRKPKKELRDGVCVDCRTLLEDYNEVNALLKKMTGKTLDIPNLTKLSPEELEAATKEAAHVALAPPPGTPPLLPLYDIKNIALEELRDVYQVKRVRFDINSMNCTCPDCKKMNGAVRTVDEAIKYRDSIGKEHIACGGLWLPLRERTSSWKPEA